MSDAGDQTGGSGDPRYDTPPPSEPKMKPIDKTQPMTTTS